MSKVTLLDAHEVELVVEEEHAHLLEALGYVRAQPRETKKEPSRRAKILPAAAEGEDEAEEAEPPPKGRARRD